MKHDRFSEIIAKVGEGDGIDSDVAQELIEAVQERNSRIVQLTRRNAGLLTALDHVTDAIKALQWEGGE